MKLVVSNLELLKNGWTVVNDSSVNSVPMDSVNVAQIEDYLSVSMVGSKPYAGAMVACKLPPPVVEGVTWAYVGLDLEVFLPQETLSFARCIETDWKGAFASAPSGGTLANVYDGSAQINLAEDMWQVDKPNNGGWVDSGVKPGDLDADNWNPISIRYALSPTGLTVVSIETNEAGVETVPPTVLPLLVTNWAAVSAVQLQLDLNNAAAALWARYRNVNVTFSDEAF